MVELPWALTWDTTVRIAIAKRMVLESKRMKLINGLLYCEDGCDTLKHLYTCQITGHQF